MSEYIMDLRKIVGHRPLLQVGASVIVEDDHGRVLLQLRSDNHCWGYAGGSVGLDEVVEDAVKRELFEETGLIAEELELHISVAQIVYTVEMDYPAFHLSMQCFACRLLSGTLQLHEHTDSRWLAADELDSVRWLPADVDVLPHLRALLAE